MPVGANESDIHDPFFPSPAPSPSLLQPVLHQSGAAGFNIIPLTVHGNNTDLRHFSADSSGTNFLKNLMTSTPTACRLDDVGVVPVFEISEKFDIVSNPDGAVGFDRALWRNRIQLPVGVKFISNFPTFSCD